MGQELSIRVLAHAPFLFFGICPDLVKVIVVPGCSWVLDFDAFLSESLELLNLIGRRHGCLQSLVLTELMRTQMVSHQQISPVLVLYTASSCFDGFQGRGGCISNLKIKLQIQVFEALNTFRKELDAVFYLRDDSSIFQVLLSDDFAGVQMATIDVVGELAQV